MFKKIKVIPWTGGPLTPAECEEHVEAQQAQSLWEVVDCLRIEASVYEIAGSLPDARGLTLAAARIVDKLKAQRIKRPKGME